MVYHSQPFQATSLNALSAAIQAFFVANPTFVPVSHSMSVGTAFLATLVYGV